MASTHELAFKDYLHGMKYREIADKYNVSVDTVKKWKTRHKWERDKPVSAVVKKTVHTVHKNKKVDKGVQQTTEPEEELSDMEQLFCYYYVKSWNATQAALKSGYSQHKASAQVAGCRLMQRPKVRQEIERLKALIKEDVLIDATDILQQYIKIAFADIGDYLSFGQKEVPIIGMFGPLKDEEGNELTQMVNYVDFSLSSEVDTSILSEVKNGKQGIAVKLADKMKALEKLELYFDLLPDKFKRRIEEEKLEIDRKKAQIDKDDAKNKNVNVIFNIPRPPKDGEQPCPTS